METELGTMVEVFEKIKNIKICMLTTKGIDGNFISRPMAVVEAGKEDLNFYFFTNEYSEKTMEIANENHVNLSFIDHSLSLYVSVSGTATLIYDKEKLLQLWNPIYKVWFPNGVDDPKLALLQVSPLEAEYWDSPDSKMVRLFGMAKSFISGETYNSAEHKHVNL